MRWLIGTKCLAIRYLGSCRFTMLQRLTPVARSLQCFPPATWGRMRRKTTMNMNRRQFFKICSAGLSGSSIALMGFSPTAALAEVRTYKLARATETRNNCPYCSVACGVLIYSTGDKSKNAPGKIIHIEGDPDDPVNRGSLCPKGAGLRDMVQSANRLKWPEVREPGSSEWKKISWMEAFDRIAKHMKA